MLIAFIFHIAISITCLFTGFLFYHLFEKRNQATVYRPVIFYLITGLIAITLITQVYILFAPASIAFRIFLLSVLSSGIILTRAKIGRFIAFLLEEYRKINLPVKLAFFSAWALLVILNSGLTTMDDTESYHIQMVKWIREYGTVPGIANLHERFGFNSSWFSSIAFFSFEWNGIASYTSLNATLSVWLSGYLLFKAGKPLNQEQDKQRSFLPLSYFFVFALAYISWPVIRGNASTANYDFISMLLIFVLIAETFSNSGKANKIILNCEWIIWPAFLFTVRFMNFSFLLLALFSFFILVRQKNWNKIFLYALVSMLLIFPFIARNLLVSGYPLYPSPLFDWFAYDWKVSRETIKEVLHFIKYFNRAMAGVESIAETESFSFRQWVFVWFKYMFTYNKIIFIPGIAGILLSPLLLKRLKFSVLSAPGICLLAVFIQIPIWFFLAADPRFVYGSLLAGILLIAAFFFKPVRISLSKLSAILFISTAIAIGLFSIYKIRSSSAYSNWLFPARLPAPPVKIISIEGIQLHIPEKILNNWNPRCYGTDLPCLYKIDPFLKPRGSDISDGFKIEKPSL